MACNGTQTGASAGTCAPVLDGQSTGECSSQSASSCGLDGTCNGAGACAYHDEALGVVQQVFRRQYPQPKSLQRRWDVSRRIFGPNCGFYNCYTSGAVQPAIIRAAVILTVMLVSVRGATVKPISVSQESALVVVLKQWSMWDRCL